jgi:hypothetical protein
LRVLRLEGLQVEEVQALPSHRDLSGDAATWGVLVERYTRNPLAPRILGETITAVFGGDIAAFLAQSTTIFGGIRQLLDEQVGRLSPLERAIGTWLAVEREPVGFADLVTDLGPDPWCDRAGTGVQERAGHGTIGWPSKRHAGCCAIVDEPEYALHVKGHQPPRPSPPTALPSAASPLAVAASCSPVAPAQSIDLETSCQRM